MIQLKTSPLQALRGLLRLFSVVLALGALGLGSWAGGSGQNGNSNNNNSDDDENQCSPGEEVTSLPMVVAPTGLTLIGAPAAIRPLVLEVDGRGQVLVQRLGRGQVAVTLLGDYRVVFDRRALAGTDVQVFFRGGEPFADGFALLSLAGSEPFAVPTERVPLPLPRLAGSAFTGVGVELHMFGPERQRVSGGAFFRGDRVIWLQATR